MKVLVTGDAGFLGSHIVDYLIANDFQVVGVDDMSGGFKRNVNELTKHYVADLFETDWVDTIFAKEKPEIVFHLAADAREGRAQFTPVSVTKNNIMASINVFKAAIKHKAKRIIFASSMAIYGDQTPPFFEGMSPKPVDLYGLNKATAEKSLAILSQVHGIEYVIIRPHNVFGPKQNIRDPYRNVVGIFMNRIMQGKPPIIYGDGEQSRSFTYVDNITPCFLAALKVPSGSIFNVGPIEVHTVNQLAGKVLEAFESDLKPVYFSDRPVEVKHAFSAYDLAVKDLGYKTIVPFEEGIRRMAQWAKALGPQPFKYLDELEIVNERTPQTWLRHEI